MLRYAYNTNGLAHHRLEDALDLLADLGYAGVGLTLDVAHLDPLRTGPEEWAATAEMLRDRGLVAAVETGGRYILDPRHKHLPSLLSDQGSERRMAFLRTALAVTRALDAECLSFWSGAKDPRLDPADAWHRLVQACSELAEEAQAKDVALAFEPEPGMFLETLADYRRLATEVGHGCFGLTLDVGHTAIEGLDPAREIRNHADQLRNVHLEDIRGRVHEHLPPGEGELDLEGVVRALTEVGYTGLVQVECSRHSHAAPEVAAQALERLRAWEGI